MSIFVSMATLVIFVVLTLMGCKENGSVSNSPTPGMQSGVIGRASTNPGGNSPATRPNVPAPQRQYIQFIDNLANMEDPAFEKEVGSVVAYQTKNRYRTFPNRLRIRSFAGGPATDLAQAISISRLEPANRPPFYLVGFQLQELYDDRTTQALEAYRLSGESIDILPAVRTHTFDMALKPDPGIVVLKNNSNSGKSEIHSSSVGALISVNLVLDEAGGQFIEKVIAGQAKFSDKFEVRACFEVDAGVPRPQSEIDADPGPMVFTVARKRVSICAVMED